MNGAARVATVAVSLIGLCVAASAQTKNKTARSGVKINIERFTGWNRDCSFKVIDVKVTTPPSHGEITTRIIDGKIPAKAEIGSSGVCAGKPTKFLQLYYKSSKGYKGSDAFTINMTVDGVGAKDFTYSVDVQ